MKTFIIITALFIGFLNCNAQNFDIKWGENQLNTPTESFSKLIQKTDNAYYLLSDKIISDDVYGQNTFLNPILEKYDLDLKLIKKLDLNKIFKSQCEIVNLAGELYVLSPKTNKAKKLNLLTANKINANTLEIEESNSIISSIEYKSLAFAGDFVIKSNSDNSKIAVISKLYKQTKLYKLNVQIYSKNWDLDYENSINLLNESNYELDKAEVSIDGEVILVVKKDKSIGNKESYDYFTYKLSNGKNTIKQSLITNDNGESLEPIIIDNGAEEIIFCMHTNQNQAIELLSSGLQSEKIKSEKYPLSQLFPTKEADFKIINDKKDSNIKLKEVISNTDGFILFFEQDASSADQIVANNQIEMGSIIIAKLGFDNKVIWTQSIKKQQINSKSISHLSFNVLEHNDDIIIIYNTEDDNILTTTVINKESGEISKNQKLSEEFSNTLPNKIQKINDTNYLVFYSDLNSKKLGHLIIK